MLAMGPIRCDCSRTYCTTNGNCLSYIGDKREQIYDCATGVDCGTRLVDACGCKFY